MVKGWLGKVRFLDPVQWSIHDLQRLKSSSNASCKVHFLEIFPSRTTIFWMVDLKMTQTSTNSNPQPNLISVKVRLGWLG